MDDTQRGFWDSIAPRYGKVGPPIFGIAGQRLLALLNLRPGDLLLDVASGTGAVALPAAEQVGPQGQVIATDLSPAMVALAQEEARRRGLANMSFAAKDALSLEYRSKHFDAVTCALALCFFPNMKKPLSEMRRILKPEGILGLSLWGRGAIVPIWPILGETLKAHGIPAPVANPIAWTEEAIKDLLLSVGFRKVDTTEERYDLSFSDAQETLDFTFSIGPLNLALSGLSKHGRRAFADDFLSRLRVLATNGAIRANFRVLYALAKKESD